MSLFTEAAPDLLKPKEYSKWKQYTPDRYANQANRESYQEMLTLPTFNRGILLKVGTSFIIRAKKDGERTGYYSWKPEHRDDKWSCFYFISKCEFLTLPSCLYHWYVLTTTSKTILSSHERGLLPLKHRKRESTSSIIFLLHNHWPWLEPRYHLLRFLGNIG